jgi:hypothetical protein
VSTVYLEERSFVIVIAVVVEDRVLLCSTDWPQTHDLLSCPSFPSAEMTNMPHRDGKRIFFRTMHGNAFLDTGFSIPIQLIKGGIQPQPG